MKHPLRPHAYLSLFFLISVCSFLYWNLIHLRPSDYCSAKRVVVELPIQKNNILQQRDHSQKDLWISREKERVHVNLISKQSELFLKIHSGKKFEALENMKDLLFTKEANWLSATEGVYSYRSRNLSLRNVKGHFENPERKSDFSAAEALLNPVHCKALGAVQITTSDAFSAQGDSLDYFLEQELFLLSRGPLFGYCSFSHAEETFALADQCSYTLADNYVFLDSFQENPLHRVLFWQKEGARSLSAERMQIRLQPQEVEAFGDVHCTFNDEEQNILKTFFSKYL